MEQLSAPGSHRLLGAHLRDQSTTPPKRSLDGAPGWSVAGFIATLGRGHQPHESSAKVFNIAQFKVHKKSTL